MAVIPNDHPRVSRDDVRRFFAFSASIVADALGRLHTMSDIRHVNRPGLLMAGSALTVRTAAGDNLMVHKAIDIAQPGDVLVIEGGGYTGRALLGDIICRLAANRGIAGIVVDGAIRDAEAIRRMNFPVFAKGATPAGPFKEGPGEINVCIHSAGATVQPGDVVFGDDDGIVVVPFDRVEEALHRALQVKRAEDAMMEQIGNGTLNRAWVDETLRRKGWLADE